MAEERIDSYIDRDGIKGDTDFVLKQLNQLYDSFKKLDGYKFDLGKANNFSTAGDSVKKLKVELDELQRIEQQLIKTYEKRQAQTSEQAKDLVAEKELLRQKNLELKNTVKENLAVENSIDALRAKLNNLTASKNKLSVDTAEYKKAEKDVLDLTNKLKALEGASGDFRRNVGNYSGALVVLEKALQDVKTKLDSYNGSGKISKETLEALTREEALLTQLVSNQANGFASATAELKNNEKALQALKNAGLQSTEFYSQLLNNTSELKDNVGDLKAEIKNLASDTSTLDGLVQGAQTLAGVYGIAQGAAALFGTENEELQKTLVKLAAVQSIVTGLQTVQNALQKEGSLMLLLTSVRTKAAAAAQTLYAFATAGSTAAMRAFRVALIGTGIGAIVVLLASAANAMGLFDSKTDDSVNSLDALNKEVEDAINKINDLNNSLDKTNTLNKIRIDIEGGSDVQKLEQDIITAQTQAANLGDALTKAFDVFLHAQTAAELDPTDDNKKALEEAKKHYDDLKKQDDGYKFSIEQNALQITLARKREGEKQAEEAQKESEKRLQRAKEFAERERKAQFELFRLAQESKIEAQKSTAGNDELGLAQRSAARLQQYEEERTLAIADRDFQLGNSKLIESERLVIKRATAAKLKELEQQTATDIINIRASVNEKDAGKIAEAEAYGAGETEKGAQKQIDSITKVSAYRQGLIEDAALAEQEVLQAQYEKGTISKEQYESGKLAIENKARRASLLEEIAYQEKLLTIVLPPEAAAAAQEKLNELRRKLRADDLKDEEVAAEKTKEIHEKKNEALKQLATELKDTVFSFLTAGLEKEKNKTQEQIDKLEEKKQKDIEVVNQTAANAQDKAAQIAIIEARAAAQREALERRKRQLDMERARYERASNIASIIQSTASAVVGALGAKPWTPANIALAAIVGAIGAAQIARTLATPLPKYARGRKGGPEEFAIVGDGGRKEVIEYATGEKYLTPDTPTITYLPKGATVHPDAAALMSMPRRVTDHTLANAHLLNRGNDRQFQNMTSTLSGDIKQLGKIIKNKTEVHIKTASARDLLFKDGPSFREYLNDHI